MYKSNFDYLKYNREERHLCSHLFRVLHEPKNNYKILHEFLGNKLSFTDFNIFSEVALLRDAFHVRNTEGKLKLMDDIIKIVSKQLNVDKCTSYSKLTKDKAPHPRHLLWKSSNQLNNDEKKVYAEVQAIFNAKPDLAIVTDDTLLIYEIKFTQQFYTKQLKRTEMIGIIWAKLLYKDLGFLSKPTIKFIALGKGKHTVPNPWEKLSWQFIADFVNHNLPQNDKSVVAINNAVQYLNSNN